MGLPKVKQKENTFNVLYFKTNQTSFDGENRVFLNVKGHLGVLYLVCVRVVEDYFKETLRLEVGFLK